MPRNTEEARVPSSTRLCGGVIAISVALLAGLLTVMPGAPLQPLSIVLATDGAVLPASSAASIHAGVDWQSVERASMPAGAAVAAYDCPPAPAGQ